MKKMIKRKGSRKSIKKKNSRREKGGTKGRKKAGRKPRKSRKLKKSGKKEKNDKKTNKITKRRMRNRNRSAGRQTTNSTISCLQDSILYTKFLKDNVINFLRRKTRLAASNKQTSNKANKKGEFKEPAARLIQVKRRPQ